MKKILALILSVLMIATAFCAVIPASAAVNIHTIFDLPAYYVGGANQASAHDITDGKISDGEYTFSETLANENKVAYGSYLIEASDTGGSFFANAATSKGIDEITLHMAHDDTYVYVAIESNDAVDTKQRPYNILITRPNATTYGEMLDRLSFVIDRPVAGGVFADGTSQVTVYQYVRNTEIAEDGSRTGMANNVPTLYTDYDAYVTLDTANDKGLVEFRLTKQAIVNAFGLNSTDDVDQVGVALQHRMDGGDLACYFAKELSVWGDRKSVIDAYTLSATPCWLPYTMNLKAEGSDEPVEPEEPKTFAEALERQNYYVGNKVTATPDITNGVIGADEYTFTQTLVASGVSQQLFFRNSLDNVTDRPTDAVDTMTLHMAYDDDYIYMAMVTNQPVTDGNFHKNFISGAISRPNPTTYTEMMDRVSFRATSAWLTAGAGTVECTFSSYCNRVTVNADGTVPGVTSLGAWGTSGEIKAYYTLTSDYIGISEMKISKQSLADAFGIAKTDITNVGVALSHLIFNGQQVDGTWVPVDATLPGGGDRAAHYIQILTDEEKEALLSTDTNLTNINTWAPYVMNFSEAKVDTLNGASVRISNVDNKTGLRFKTVFDDAAVEALVGTKEFTVGTLIAPTDTLTDVEFTKAALDEAGIAYLNVTADYDNAFAKDATAGTTTIAGSIVGIKEENLDRDFSAIGYICVDGTYYYSDSASTTRNVKAVATIALGDLKAVQTAEYVYEVSAGVYSPYTAAQRVMLSKLNGTYEG